MEHLENFIYRDVLLAYKRFDGAHTKQITKCIKTLDFLNIPANGETKKLLSAIVNLFQAVSCLKRSVI